MRLAGYYILLHTFHSHCHLLQKLQAPKSIANWYCSDTFYCMLNAFHCAQMEKQKRAPPLQTTHFSQISIAEIGVLTYAAATTTHSAIARVLYKMCTYFIHRTQMLSK